MYRSVCLSVFLSSGARRRQLKRPGSNGPLCTKKPLLWHGTRRAALFQSMRNAEKAPRRFFVPCLLRASLDSRIAGFFLFFSPFFSLSAPLVSGPLYWNTDACLTPGARPLAAGRARRSGRGWRSHRVIGTGRYRARGGERRRRVWRAAAARTCRRGEGISRWQRADSARQSALIRKREQ